MNIKTILLTGAMLCAATVQSAAQTLYGSVLNNGTQGVYSFDVTQPDKGWTLVEANTALSAEGAGTRTPQFYCNIHITDNAKLLTVSDADLLQTLRVFKVDNACLDMTYNPSNKLVYGVAVVNNESVCLSKINPLTGEYTKVGDMTDVVNTIASDASGNLFGISQEGKLYKISRGNASMTEIGSTGLEPFAQQSMAIDPTTGVCYWAFYNDSESGLYTVNLTTGKATLVKKFENHEEVTALSVAPTAAADAPKVATNLQLATDAFKFTLPTQTENGSALTGTLNYNVTLTPISEDETAPLVPQTLSGTGNPGEAVSLAQTFAVGYHLADVTVTANKQTGLRAAIYNWVGADVPATPTNAKAVKESANTVKISWDAVSTTAHGGACDLTNLTYDVVRMPGNVTVAEGVKTTTVTDTYNSSTLRKYHYQVYAIADDAESVPAQTEGVVLGPAVKTPYAEDFSTTTGFGVLTVTGHAATWYQDLDNERVVFNGDNAQKADEWLITPPIDIKNDSVYSVSFDVLCESQQKHKLAVMMGNLPNPDALSTVVMKETEFKTDFEWQHVELEFRGEGEQYLALHLTSDPYGFPFYVDNLSVKALYSTSVPAAPAFTVTPDADGGLTVKLAAVTPTSAIDGTPLSGAQNVSFCCDGEEVGQETATAPGMSVEKLVTVEKGLHVFSARVGNGAIAKQEAWVGLDMPKAVSDIVVTENDGKVTLTWKAPTEGQHGGKLGDMTYSVKYNGWKEIAGTSDLTATMEKNEWKNSQSTDYFVLSAISEGGEGEPVQTNSMTFGRPLNLPYYESFLGGHAAYEKWTTLPLGAETTWTPVADVSMDEQGGAILLSGIASQANEAYVLGPKWNFLGVAKPKVEFGLTHANIDDVLDVVLLDANRQEHLLEKISLKGVSDWKTYSYDVSAYAGQTFAQLLLRTHNIRYGDQAYVDCVKLTEEASVNLSASSPVMPASIAAGTEGVIKAPVANVGQEDVKGDAYNVSLYKGETLVATFDGVDVKAGESVQVEMKFTPTVADLYSVEMHYVINCESDVAKDNNKSVTDVLNVVDPVYPMVKNFAADEHDGDVVFSWQEPDIQGGTEVGVTESFESFEAFSYDALKPWQTYHYNYGSREYTMEFQDAGGNWITYKNSGENMGWQVFDVTQVTEASGIGLTPLSGNQFILSPYCSGTTINAIETPTLSGNEQTIRINAKSLNNRRWGLETFEVLDDDDNVLATFKDVPDEWTCYDVKVPAGVRKVTIQVTPVTALLLDDITYVPKDAATTQYHLTGYNVYCDGKLVATLPTTQLTYTAENVAKGDRWGVTAVYEEGESGYSEIYVTDIKTLELRKNEKPAYWVNPLVKIRNGQKILVR